MPEIISDRVDGLLLFLEAMTRMAEASELAGRQREKTLHHRIRAAGAVGW